MKEILQKDAKPDEELSLKERFSALKNLPAFFKLIWETDPWMALTNAVLRVLRASIPLLMLYVGKLIIDEVLRLSNEGGDMTWIFQLLAAELLLAVLSDILSRGTTLTDGLLGDKFANRSSVMIMEHAAELDLAQFEDANFYDKLERARRQTLGRTVLMSQVLGQIQDIITMGFLMVGLVAFNPYLIILLIVAVIPAFMGESHFNVKTYSLTRGWTPERRELDYLRYTGASDETAKEVKMFGLSDFFTARFKELSDGFYKANSRIAVRRAGWGAALALLGTAAYYGAYLYIIMKTVEGRITIGDLTFLSGSFMKLRGLLEGVLNRFSNVAQGSLYLADFFEFFEMEPKVRRNPNAAPFPHPIKEGIVFENVGFKYEGGNKWALRDLNFKLRAGEKLALVGENGAGKTTLVKLLARLYEPTEGRILIDGTDLREFDPLDLRKEIGVIFQDFVRFQLTAGDNIAVGKIDRRDDMERIESAAEDSLADEVIEELPKGYQQMIGRRFAEGIDLSGGQWQKVALARAYMRDAQLLILDEPTAALDARAEHEVFQRFTELTKGKTAVLISHRFSTVRMADRILVIENGTRQEMGTHDELMAADGRYAELFRLQAEGYK